MIQTQLGKHCGGDLQCLSENCAPVIETEEDTSSISRLVRRKRKNVSISRLVKNKRKFWRNFGTANIRKKKHREISEGVDSGGEKIIKRCQPPLID